MNYPIPTKVLIVDDNQAIHADFAKILRSAHSTTALDDLQRLTFSDPVHIGSQPTTYELEFVYQGAEALERVQTAASSKRNYALAFVDMRMPPGWDGLQTIEQLWAVDPALQIVICSAYSDYDWDYVLGRLNRPNNLLIVKKPFAAIEVLQSANALTGKWHSERELRHHLSALEDTIQRRTARLEETNEQLREQMRLRQAVEIELGLAQKLESVGRLAAGIAHEINTPIQYIGDSVHFLGSAFADLLTVITATDNPRNSNPGVDMAFLREEVPHAIERIMEGTQRVATIVRAMKDFAHPDATEKAASDLNRALETTLLIAKSEYKYVATVDLQCGAIPEVMCNVGELSQVFLNLIVNAAHALADAGRDCGTGRITIRTQLVDRWVELHFEDNGCGIPEEIIAKIYDPFFTTKEIGRGSGQGLAMARSIVVDKHAGRISVASTPNVGTCFTLRLPVCGSLVIAP
ncbi:MAG: ATP-binding protein [Steroidobacteraceae bacterium]